MIGINVIWLFYKIIIVAENYIQRLLLKSKSLIKPLLNKLAPKPIMTALLF
jgi:hypothetical protein